MATSILGVSKKKKKSAATQLLVFLLEFFFFFLFLYGFSGSAAHMKLLLDRGFRLLFSIFHISGTDLIGTWGIAFASKEFKQIPLQLLLTQS